MRSRVLARGRAACACALLTAAVAGCTSSGSANSSVTVSGNVLTIYVSAAPTDQPQVAQDVLDAEQLAFSQSSHAVGGRTIRMLTVRGSTISAQARTVIQDTSSIAYLGEIVPGSSYASLGITNALDILQVTPTDTALELTQATPAVANAPDGYYESLSTYGRTFARVVPTSGDEAKAQVQEMQALGVSKLYVASDGSDYGAAIANAVTHDVGGGITLVSGAAAADGVFYGSASPAVAARFFNRVAGSNPSAKLFGPSALDAPAFVSALSPAVRNLYVSVPGFLKADLTPAGTDVRLAVHARRTVTPRPSRRSSATRRWRRCYRCSSRPAPRRTAARPSSRTSSRSGTASRCSGHTRSIRTVTRASRRSCSTA